MKFLITGGAGFIGSALIRKIINETDNVVINIDKITYAASRLSLKTIEDNENYFFEKVDICDINLIRGIFTKYNPDAVIHLAAESHVDRSIEDANNFINTNIFGTYNLLEQSKNYFNSINIDKQKKFKFLHISTDEVYGDLDFDEAPANEKKSYAPSSPYSASKASSDHLVRAWERTYNLPTLITNCSNNYGPYQFSEKLIPLIILNALEKKPLPIYGDGNQIRDWLYVEDHIDAILTVMEKGKKGNTYNVGGDNEIKNIDVVNNICDILDELVPVNGGNIFSYSDLIQFVEDRPGHDRRYSIDATKIRDQLGWKPKESFKTGIRKTVEWYIKNKSGYKINDDNK
tara:strand:- start:640 stop:1674 length:1035 start_codon:yes stop_codon:yes gene_type:complete